MLFKLTVVSTGVTLSQRTCIGCLFFFVAYTAPLLPSVIITVSHPVLNNLFNAIAEFLKSHNKNICHGVGRGSWRLT